VVKATIEQAKTVRMPFLVSVGDKLYVHFSVVTQKQAMKAYTAQLNPIFDQIVDEIRKTDGVGQVELHGMLAWGITQETISLSEFKLTKDSLNGS